METLIDGASSRFQNFDFWEEIFLLSFDYYFEVYVILFWQWYYPTTIIEYFMILSTELSLRAMSVLT